MYVRQRESGSRHGRGSCDRLCPATTPGVFSTATPRGLLSPAALPLTDLVPSPRGERERGSITAKFAYSSPKAMVGSERLVAIRLGTVAHTGSSLEDHRNSTRRAGHMAVQGTAQGQAAQASAGRVGHRPGEVPWQRPGGS